MAGTLYIVATPIGNLEDMPPRVAATFGAADFIAAEDTRVTMKLLNYLGLKKPMVSYYEHALQTVSYTHLDVYKRQALPGLLKAYRFLPPTARGAFFIRM